MHYIIMDLEWNNTYARRIKGFINEVIEVGAVMLDENLEYVDEFSRIVRSQIGKKLRGNVKRLTHITNDEVRSGEPFTKVMSEFKAWIGDEENVVLTWGDGDIRVLIENYRYLNGLQILPFLTNYMDIQRYFQIKKEIPKSKQIGLFAAAEMVGVDAEEFAHHRALDDSIMTAECMRRVFDERDFFDHVVVCDDAFYQKLQYKPHAIGNINHPLVDKSLLSFTCDKCGTKGEQLTDWRYGNQFFRANFHCPVCDYDVRVAVRFKKYFDRLETKKNVSIISNEKVKKGAD
ncbi:MAG: exonuclease domain-containing protein [Clostridia bacterium]|nr:exonuclease domain-containing protein [Clostridia bacterium]